MKKKLNSYAGASYVRTELVSDRFRNIKRHLRDCPEKLDLFLVFLGKYLPSKRISPQGFVSRWDRAYYDLKNKKGLETEVEKSLAEEPGLVFFNIIASFKNVVKTIFPPKLADKCLEIARKR